MLQAFDIKKFSEHSRDSLILLLSQKYKLLAKNNGPTYFVDRATGYFVYVQTLNTFLGFLLLFRDIQTYDNACVGHIKPP